jgi:hypothetical protein
LLPRRRRQAAARWDLRLRGFEFKLGRPRDGNIALFYALRPLLYAAVNEKSNLPTNHIASVRGEPRNIALARPSMIWATTKPMAQIFENGIEHVCAAHGRQGADQVSRCARQRKPKDTGAMGLMSYT